jgi:two-component system heavy metal sensor histidine kinase CusS
VTRPSLRRRLAVGASALAGGTLLGFALLSSWLINQAKVERLDVQIETALLRMGRLPGGRLPPDVETALAQELGTGNKGDVALQLVDADGSIVFQSEPWPEALQPVPPPRLTTYPPPAAPPPRCPAGFPTQTRRRGKLQHPTQPNR